MWRDRIGDRASAGRFLGGVCPSLSVRILRSKKEHSTVMIGTSVTSALALTARPTIIQTVREGTLPMVVMKVEAPERQDREGRVALAVLASAGAVETSVITYDKLELFGAGDGSVVEKLCSSAGGGSCGDVLNSPWADVGGVPLSLFGALGYFAVALAAAAPLLGVGGAPEDSQGEGDSLSSALVFGSGALAAFSTCLMLLLGVVIQQPCALCYGSAALSLAIFGVAWSTPLLPNKTEQAVVTGTGALISLAAAATLFFADGGTTLVAEQQAYRSLAQIRASAGQEMEEKTPVAPPQIRSKSTTRALDIAKRLQARNAQFYGAYWCSHCANQKEILGKEAMSLIPYNECDKDGVNSKRAQCKEAGISGYPTWSLDGKLYPGERDLDELENMLKGEVTVDSE